MKDLNLTSQSPKVRHQDSNLAMSEIQFFLQIEKKRKNLKRFCTQDQTSQTTTVWRRNALLLSRESMADFLRTTTAWSGSINPKEEGERVGASAGVERSRSILGGLC